MKTILEIISWSGLALTLVPAMLVFMSMIAFDSHLWLMLLGMLLWFGGRIGMGVVQQ